MGQTLFYQEIIRIVILNVCKVSIHTSISKEILNFKVSYGNCTAEATPLHTTLSARLPSSPAFLQVDTRIAVRRPRPILQLNNLSNTFSRFTWIVFYITLLVLSGAMAVSFAFYRVHLPFLNRDSLEIRFLDFFIRPLTAITEPDPICWFQNQTTDFTEKVCFFPFLGFFFQFF